MVNLLFSENSLEETKEYPHLRIGLHLVFDTGRLVFSSDSSLTDRTDFFERESMNRIKKEGFET